MRILLPLLALLLAAPAAAAPPPPDEVERRVAEILARMTLPEKIGQLNLVSNGPGFDPEAVRRGEVGAVMNFNDAPDIAAMQRLNRESRLGIPLFFSLDVLQGFRTMFPVPLAQTATFDPGLARLASLWAGREAAATGLNWTFAPMADLSRDPRWGRIVEGSGEDPLLNRVFTAARVSGFREGGVATSAKHFAGYGAAAGGRDYDATDIAPGEFLDAYLPPFRAAVEAGTESVMSAFNALNGVPSTGNPSLLTGTLRGRWGFDGFVVSDWSAIEELMNHGVAGTGADAARQALLAGVDMDMQSGLYRTHLADEVAAGRVPLAAVDEAARRVLRIKVRMGLFEQPDADPEAARRAILTPEARAAARRVARESMVLLRNENRTLPLGPGRSIALIGSLAANGGDQIGPHGARGWPDDSVTFLRGLSDRAAAAGVRLAHAPGCPVLCRSTEGFAEAVAAARAADVVVAVLGEPRELSGEAASRAYLTLPDRQPDLLEALLATGKPVVLVLMGGRPLTLGPAHDRLAALLMAWYPGTEGGAALADVLFGDENPAGRLPVSWPRTVGQLPLHYNRLPTGRPPTPGSRFTAQYADEAITPLYPFGHGLSYTRFAYRDLEVATPRLGARDTVEVRVSVTNTGDRAGAEVAQLYVRDPVASRSRPLRELKGFQKVTLAPGETRRLTFRIPAAELGFHQGDGAYGVEAGRFDVWVGGDSLATLAGAFEVTEGLTAPAR